MHRHLIGPLLVMVSLVGVRSTSAQDAGAIGVTMGYPASVGLLWHASEGLALRPELSFSHISTETEPSTPIGIQTSTDGTTVSVGLSALLYLARWDTLRTYVVPRYAFSRASSELEGPITALSFESTTKVHSISVAFGAQHLLGQHFAIYGELGMAYERLRTDSTAAEARGNSFGTRSGIGVVVYF